jgi:hypothetical protein
MKPLHTFILASFSCLQLFSQDTLYTRNGDVINGKVMEVNQDEIKYKKPSNPNGPLYVVSKSDIVLIHYKNGSKDVFQNSSGTSAGSSNTDANASQSGNPSVVNNNYSSNSSGGGGYGGYGGYAGYGGYGGYGGPGMNFIFGGGFPFFPGFGYWGGGWGGYGGYYRRGGFYGGYRGGYHGGGFYGGGGFHGGGHGHR